MSNNNSPQAETLPRLDSVTVLYQGRRSSIQLIFSLVHLVTDLSAVTMSFISIFVKIITK